ncbi:AfsR/SARP family transcriptional regulator [Glycomyces paridis]|nr:BTAD domain-containing putative transcriptional regulator [Glycomyces paridis]
MLGPLEVRGDDGPLPLRGRHHPKLLAMLLDEADRVVPVDRITAALWDEDPPESARQQIHNVVAGLRAQLGPAGSRLRTVGDGYRMELATGELDALRCKANEAEARALLDAGDREAAAEALRAALAEWRGPVLAGLKGRTVESVALRWEEHRLALVEKRIDLDLDTRAHDDLVPELRQLTAAQPLRQRFTEQLMLALHRSGRTPDALRTYADLRDRLAEELGADPGQSLRDLHTAILRGDPGLDAPAPIVNAPFVTPALLPSDVAAFTGRGDDLRALDAMLDDAAPDVRLATVTGTGGVGKTTIAVHWAHAAADRFPDGQLFIDLRGFDPHHAPLRPDEAARAFLDALGTPNERIPIAPEAQIGLYRSLLADRRMLVVLDNAADAAQVRPLLPGGRGNCTVVTSRNPLYGLVASQGARPRVIRELPFDDAHAFLERRLGKDRVAAEPEAAERIIDRCARLPLALAIAAARAASHPDFGLAALAGELDEAGGRLDALAGDDPATDVRTVLGCSYRGLSAPAARLFRLLGLHPGPDVTAPAAASLAAAPVREVRRSLAELAGEHLLTEHEPGRYTFHDLLRAYAAELVEDEPDRDDASRRMFDHYAHTTALASKLIKPENAPIGVEPAAPGVVPEDLADAEAATAWAEAERRTLMGAVDLAAATGSDAAAWTIAWCFCQYVFNRGHWHDGLVVQSVALRAAVRSGDVIGQIYSHRFLGIAHNALSEHTEANRHLRKAIAKCDTTEHRRELAQTHRTFGQVLGRQRDYVGALWHGRRALAISMELGVDRFQAQALNAVGWFHAQLGDYDAALEHCERSLALQVEFESVVGQAITWDSIGYVHHRQGRLHQAVDCYRRSLECCEMSGNRHIEAETLEHLGDVHLDLGDLPSARAAWQQSLALVDALGSVVRAKAIREKLAA